MYVCVYSHRCTRVSKDRFYIPLTASSSTSTRRPVSVILSYMAMCPCACIFPHLINSANRRSRHDKSRVSVRSPWRDTTKKVLFETNFEKMFVPNDTMGSEIPSHLILDNIWRITNFVRSLMLLRASFSFDMID